MLSIIIPAWNEEEGIPTVVAQLRIIPFISEIIVVDDGSTDATAAKAKAAGATVLRQPANGGYGLALKAGIRAARNDLIAITDADGTYAATDLPTLFAKMEEGFDMAVGARHGKQYWGTFLKMPARFIFKLLVEFSTGRHIPDINSGLRIFRKSDVLPLFPQLCDTFSFTTTITLAYCFLHKFIAYVPISYAPRIGRSKVRIVRDSLRTLQYIVESIVYFNPLKLFLLIIFFLLFGAFVSAFGGWWIGEPWLGMVALLFFLSSVVTFAIAVTADLLHQRR